MSLNARGAFVVLIAVVACAGCGVTARLGAGPSLDTEGNVGLDTRLTMGLGPYNHPTGVLATGTFGAGSGNGGQGMLQAGVGLEGVTGDKDHHLRGGLLFSSRNYLANEGTSLYGIGANLAYGWSVTGHADRGVLIDDRSNVTVGPELQGELLGGDDSRGVFSLPLVLEAFSGASL